MGVRLPAEYQEVVSLCSDTNQYIDTGIIADNETGFFVDAQKLMNNHNDAVVIGSRENNGATRCWIDVDHSSYDGRLFIGWNGYTPVGQQQVYLSTNRFTASVNYKNTRKAFVNGAEHAPASSQLSATLATQTHSLYLFGANYAGKFGVGFCGRIFACKISKGITIIADYVPCYRKADSKPGMYDLVTGEFFVNQGTGEFLVGPDVIGSISPLMVAWRRAMMARMQPRLPIEYQEVPFIIGQGKQYIDTGYVLNSECRVQGRYDLYGTSSELKSVFALFGSRNDRYNNAFAMFNVSAAPRVDYGNTLETHSFSYAEGNNGNVLEFDLNAGIATVNGRTYAFADSLKPFTCPSTAMIFAAHTGDTIDTRCPKGEIVYLKITDENGTVVRDMIPCYRKSDNKPGMYDLANNQFYTNAGTGEFQLPS